MIPSSVLFSSSFPTAPSLSGFISFGAARKNTDQTILEAPKERKNRKTKPPRRLPEIIHTESQQKHKMPVLKSACSKTPFQVLVMMDPTDAFAKYCLVTVHQGVATTRNILIAAIKKIGGHMPCAGFAKQLYENTKMSRGALGSFFRAVRGKQVLFNRPAEIPENYTLRAAKAHRNPFEISATHAGLHAFEQGVYLTDGMTYRLTVLPDEAKGNDRQMRIRTAVKVLTQGENQLLPSQLPEVTLNKPKKIFPRQSPDGLANRKTNSKSRHAIHPKKPR